MKTIKGLYKEKETAGNRYRAEYLEQIQNLIAKRRTGSHGIRESWFDPDATSLRAYTASLKPLRRRFCALLGWPLTEPAIHPHGKQARVRFVAEDSLSTIHRVQIPVMEGLFLYGILFLPHQPPPFRLVISQHGGMGSPELASGFFGSENYNNMTRKVLKQGFAVFAPQLLLWREAFGPKFDRVQIDAQLKQLGGSITALELYSLSRALDWLLKRRDMKPGRVGMIGLSYGGFYSLFAAAVDRRIATVVSSCFFNDRFRYDFKDWTWFDAAHRFLDAEVCGLICPRPLYVEIGKHDPMFKAEYAGPAARRVERWYRRLGIADRFRFVVFDGGHELDPSDRSIAFLREHLTT